MTTKKRGRPQKDSNTLSKKLIIETAKKLMIDGGKIPSIRSLSSQLNIDAMAIYYYFKNKNVLLEALTTSLISEIYQPQKTLEWEVELRKLSKSYIALLSKYDGLLQTLLTMKSISPANVFISRFKIIIKELNMNVSIEKAALNLLADYLHGFSFSMSCDSTGKLNVDDIDESLDIIFNGINALIGRSCNILSE
ncbi:TetR/AcrR family transcriptional regulator [Pseudoalteromonas denitrificans]|uniref:Transcriptional regulator, TetR family n=1 Tax=Pseudoalteromonas denitrificans DSM 6059 TaxID=1123010 RepID=A0A1I1IIS9_9GAMM|nr:TetR/AcrR family transcriptional regulator [Pseudoalteromonas denitrificans]SFC33120.1 transcriptional regulator, TetR family [Pseudoalteromonas denitrificans DSM 6059]